jgi:hypothetical protein
MPNNHGEKKKTDCDSDRLRFLQANPYIFPYNACRSLPKAPPRQLKKEEEKKVLRKLTIITGSYVGTTN